MEGVTIIKAVTLSDHVHMYVSIMTKESVTKVRIISMLASCRGFHREAYISGKVGEPQVFSILCNQFDSS